MHELALCESLINQVADVARQNRAGPVVEVHVSVGPLSGVEPPLMRGAFPIAAAGTVARDATLFLEPTSIRVQCGECGKESDVEPNNLVCRHCGDWRTHLLSGDELILQRVVMEEAHV